MDFEEYSRKFYQSLHNTANSSNQLDSNSSEFHSFITGLDFGQLSDAQISLLNNFYPTPYYTRENSWHIGNGFFTTKEGYLAKIKELEKTVQNNLNRINQLRSKL